MKRIVSMVMLCIIIYNGDVYAQNRIEIGTKISYPGMENYRGRKVVLDLFSSGCKVCFASFPKMQSLHQKYRGKVDFLMIGLEDGKIQNTYRTFEKRLSLDLDVVFDSLFFQRYDFTGMPVYIWIDEKNVVQAVTSITEMSEHNLDSFISGNFSFRSEKSRSIPFDQKRPFNITDNRFIDTNSVFQSILAKSLKADFAYYPQQLQFVEGTGLFQAFNITRDQLYRMAYAEKLNCAVYENCYANFYPRPIILDDDKNSMDSSFYRSSFLMPVANRNLDALRRSLKNDLRNYFGYDVMITRMPAPCWTLVSLPGKRETLRSKADTMSVTSSYAGFYARKIPVSRIISLLDGYRKDGLQIVDRTGIDFPIDIDLDVSIFQLSDLIGPLHAAGLDLVKGEKMMTVMLLTKNGNNVATVQ